MLWQCRRKARILENWSFLRHETNLLIIQFQSETVCNTFWVSINWPDTISNETRNCVSSVTSSLCTSLKITEWCQISLYLQISSLCCKTTARRWTTLYKDNYQLCEVHRSGHEKSIADQRQNDIYKPSIHKYWISKLAFRSG